MPPALPLDPREAPVSRLGDEAKIFIAAMAFRAVTAVVAFLSNLAFPSYRDQRLFSVLREPHFFWDAFARFDSGWYQKIAEGGYLYVEGGRNNLAFFPLYPMLMGGLGRLFGGRQEEFYLAGIVVSWLAFGFAMMLVYRLARLDLSREASLRAVAYAALFPFAYFFGMVYSESLFLLVLVGAAYAFRTRRWVLGALAGAAVTATRVTGLMAVPGLAWIAWRAAGDDPRDRARALAAAAATTAGIGGYSLYCWAVTGTPIAWYESIVRWEYHPGGSPFVSLFGLLTALASGPYTYLTGGHAAPYDMLNGLAAFGALALTPLVWKRFGAGYALIVLCSLLLPLSSGQFEGLGRYTAVLFPVPLVLAAWGGEMRHTALLACSVMLYTLGLALFVNAHPLF